MGTTARRRLTAWATCLGFVASLALAHQHLAGTLHGFCSDHGELVHLHGEARGKAPPAPGASTVRTHVHVAGDHGCPLLEFLVTPTTTTGHALASQTGKERRARWRRTGLEAAAPISLLRQAPKHSPPPG